MRRFLSVTLALVAGLFVLGAPSAVAGGPTSVLLVNYENGRAAAAFTESTAYGDLQSILGDENPPAKGSPPPGLLGVSSGGIRLVWLIHDVHAWRIDNVHIDGKDVWVETYLNATGSDPYAAEPVWHKPARAADLVGTLTGLGLIGTGSAADAGSSTAALGAVAQQAGDAAGAEPAPTGARWWLVAAVGALGLALGAVLGRRVTTRPHSARQVAAMG